MAAQRRSLLQSVRNRPAFWARGWEPRGACRVQPQLHLRLWAAFLSLAGCGRRPPLSQASPSHFGGWGRMRPREARACALSPAVGGSASWSQRPGASRARGGWEPPGAGRGEGSPVVRSPPALSGRAIVTSGSSGHLCSGQLLYIGKLNFQNSSLIGTVTIRVLQIRKFRHRDVDIFLKPHSWLSGRGRINFKQSYFRTPLNL